MNRSSDIQGTYQQQKGEREHGVRGRGVGKMNGHYKERSVLWGRIKLVASFKYASYR